MTDESVPKNQEIPLYKNSRKAIITPLVLGLVLAAGILIGNVLTPSSGSSATGFLPAVESNKLNAIINYLEENYVDSIDKNKIIEATIPDLLKQLDPHSTYIPAADVEEANAPLEGNFEGIGIQFNVQQDTILVVNTIAGGPSEKVGILPGDRIVEINDSLFAGVGVTDRDVIKNLKGERGSIVKVGVHRMGHEEILDFTITRDKIPLYSVDISYMPADGVGYIKLSKFARSTHQEFVAAAEKLLLDGMESLIFDLRGNSGGYLDAAIAIADEFLEEDKMIVYTEGFSRQRASYYSTSAGTCKDVKLYILIDSWSASASEIVAGAIQDNDRGWVIGRRSFGKGLVQEPTFFRDGSQMRLTVARYYTPTGRCIQKPYTKGADAYYHELADRFEEGELDSIDVGKLPDSLKFTTPQGKVVYGGGGVLPDIFVPADTVGTSAYFAQAVRSGLIYRYSLYYTDMHRNELSRFKEYNALYNYLKNSGLVNDFFAFAAKEGLPRNEAEIATSRHTIEVQLYAYITRNILDDAGFYPILHKIDAAFLKAVQVAKGAKAAL